MQDEMPGRVTDYGKIITVSVWIVSVETVPCLRTEFELVIPNVKVKRHFSYPFDQEWAVTPAIGLVPESDGAPGDFYDNAAVHISLSGCPSTGGSQKTSYLPG